MSQKRKKVSFAASAHWKTVKFFRCCRFCTALENFSEGAHAHGRQQGKGQGPNTSSQGIWNWLRHAQFHCKTLKFSLAPSALTLITLKFSLRHLKFAKVSTFCRRCAKNWRFCYSGFQIPFILSKKLNICKNVPFVDFDAQKTTLNILAGSRAPPWKISLWCRCERRRREPKFWCPPTF